MAFCIKTNGKKIRYKYDEIDKPYYSSLWEDENTICVFEGEFHSTEKYFHDINWKNVYKNINDSFSFIQIDKQKLIITFVTSKFGLENLFYFYDGENFCISDSFWEIADLVCNSEGDISQENVKEAMNGCYPIIDGTYLNNVFYVQPSIIGTYSQKDGLKLERYFEFRYLPDEKMDNKKVSEEINRLIKKAIIKVKEECGDVRYAYGLSGGLDSRLISFYAKNLPIESFIIGDPRPHRILLANDHRNARKIASLYGKNHTECNWNLDVFNYVKLMDIKNDPMGAPQFFKGQKEIDIDVLLTGGNGYIVGSTIPDRIEELTEENLAKVLLGLGREFIPRTQRSRHIEKAIKLILNKDVQINSHKKWFEKIHSNSIEERMEKKYIEYIREEKLKGKKNIDIYEGYFHNILGARNKYGGFESLSGTVRSFSIYNPHVLVESLKWPVEALKDRKALKMLIKTHMPLAYDIGEQKYEGSLDEKKRGLFLKIINIFMFVLRGNGSEMVNSKYKYVRTLFVKEMKIPTKWFFNIFDIKNDIDAISRFDNKYAILKFWKIKIVLDMLETRQYKEYLSKSQYKDID